MGPSVVFYLAHVCIVFLLIFAAAEQIGDLKNIRNHLGTRTPYRYKSNQNESQINYPNCKSSKVWMVVRHGARLPSAKDIIGMDKILKKIKLDILSQHDQGKGDLDSDQLNKFKEWTVELDEDQEKILTIEGQMEMRQLAERMQRRLPVAIKKKYSNDSFHFRYTATQRAQQSAVYFTRGLFEQKEAQKVVFAPAAKIDPLLRFYKHCDKWQKHVKKNPRTYEEQKLFGISKNMNETLSLVSKRLGLAAVLSLDEVSLMYKICGYETSWHKHHTSPWCAAFSPEDAEVLEYYYDLKHYWVDGYGYNLTYLQACLPIKNMLEKFSDKKSPKATFLFAHSGTLLKILSYLQLYKPEKHLRGSALQKDRPWKVSNIDCFAANLAFVLFKCKDGDYVLTLHQERLIKLPMCKRELCPLKYLKEYFHDSIENCDYSEICSLSGDI